MDRPKIELHVGDLPEGLSFSDSVAVDTETLGLNPHRDRLCLVQLSGGDNTAHLVQFPAGNCEAPRLRGLLQDENIVKIFHFARFDIAVLFHYLGVLTTPIYCTKIVSKLTRTYSNRHGLKDLCAELLGVDLLKTQQSSDWAANSLSSEQLLYAASDVLHLHKIKEKLDFMLERQDRRSFAVSAFNFLHTRSLLDLAGFEGEDIFSHK